MLDVFIPIYYRGLCALRLKCAFFENVTIGLSIRIPEGELPYNSADDHTASNPPDPIRTP